MVGVFAVFWQKNGHRSRRRGSLQDWLILPFVLQLVGTVGLVGYFSFKHGERTVADMGNRLVLSMGDRAYQKIDMYLNEARNVAQDSRSLIQMGILDVGQVDTLRPYLQKQLETHNLSSIHYEDRQRGEFLGVSRLGKARRLERITPQHPDQLDTHQTPLPNHPPQLHLSLRPSPTPSWYTQALNAQRPIWSPIRSWDQAADVASMALYTPVFDRTHAVRGVIRVDLTLEAISHFLQEQTDSSSAEIFVMERSGALVASSGREPTFVVYQGAMQRRPAVNSRNLLIRETTQHLLQHFHSISKVENAYGLQIETSQGTLFAQVEPYRDAQGLDWLIVVVVPESEFMDYIHTNAQTTLLLCLVATAIAILTGLLTARRIIQPIAQLERSTRQMVKGDWHPPLLLDRQDELGALSHSFHDLIQQLQTTLLQKQDLDAALAANQSQLSQILEALPLGVAMLRLEKDGPTGYLNPAAQSLLGLGVHSVTCLQQLPKTYNLYEAGTNCLYPADHLPIVKALQGHVTVTDDVEIHHPDGRIISLETTAIPVRDASGAVVCAISAFHDITARKQAEVSLREQEAQFRRIAESVPGMIYRYVLHPDGRSHFDYISPRCRELFEVEAEAALRDERVLWSVLHPDDGAILQQLLLKTAKTLQQLLVEIRLLLPSGAEKWVQAQSCPVQLPDGRVIWDGIVVDITDRKQTAHLLEEYSQNLEQEVRDRTLALEREIAERKQVEAVLLEQESFLATVLDHVGAFVFMKDLNGNYTYVNQLWCDALGISKPELLQSSAFQAYTLGHQNPLQQQDLQAIQQGQVLRLYEDWIYPNGEYHHLLTILVPLRSAEGKVYAVCGIATDITELKQAEAALRQSEARNQAIIHAMPDLILTVNREGRVLDYSRTEQFQDLCQEHSCSRGQLLHDLLPNAIATRHLHHIYLALETGQLQCYEQAVEVNGCIQHEEVRVTPVDCETTLIIVRDISDRKRIEAERAQMEAKLHTQQEFLSSVIDICPYPIFVKDIESRFVLLNQAAAAIYNKPINEMLGKRDADFNRDQQQSIDFITSNNEVMATGQIQVFNDQAIRNCQGELRWYQTTIKPFVDAQQNIQGIIGAQIDITDRKQAEVDLKAAKDEAEAANRAKSTFLASMSHELRTPLNAILGFAQIMRHDTTLCADHQRYLEIINRSGEHLLELINGVLDLSKIEAGHLELTESEFHLPNLVEMVTAMLRGRAIERDIQLDVQLAEDLPEFIITDPGKLRQVLINLLGNAIKFTDRGSVVLRVSSHVTAPHRATLTFEIQDTGCGVASADLHRIFAAFEQTGSGGRLTEGTGLGLTLSQRFVQMMGGTIQVQSQLGQGSTFTFHIQCAVSTMEEDGVTEDDRPIIGLAPDQPTYRILVVDDLLENRALLVEMLSSLGFTVEQATNGEEAIALWQRWQPHLILMDIRMPTMNGLEATRQIRLAEGHLNNGSAIAPATVIIAISASVFHQDCDHAIEVGCDGFLTKPFRERELLDKLTQFLGVRYVLGEAHPSTEANRSSMPPLTPELLQQAPSNWLEQLYEATIICDDSEIFKLLKQLPEEHHLLCQGLYGLAQQFQFERILTLLGRDL